MGTFLGGLVASRVNTQKEGCAAQRLTAEGKPSPLLFVWLLLSAGGHCPICTGTHALREENAD